MIAQQSHLRPLSLLQPVQWNLDHSLFLFPLPNLVLKITS